nr:MAG TPA: hypothetical protein [Caudoviricetes sp.]
MFSILLRSAYIFCSFWFVFLPYSAAFSSLRK